MSEEIQKLKFVVDTKSLDEANIKLQQEKDKVQELNKAIKDLGKESGARKDLIIEKAQAEKNIKDIRTNIKEYEKEVKEANKGAKASFIEVWAAVQLGIMAFKKVIGAVTGFKNAARDAVETNQKFKVVFSSIEKDAEKMAKSLAEAFDLSGTTAKKLLSDTGNLLIGFGMTEDAALKMSFSINTIAQDLVSFTNYTGGTEAAAQALTSAMTGNTRAAKSLGIVIRQENAEFKNRVKYLQENNGLTQQAATSTAIYEQIVQQTQKSVGDYARTHDQLANTERRRQEVQKEVAEYMGKQLVPIFTTWNNVAANFMKLLLPDEFKDVSTEIKAAHDRLVELRTQLQGLTKDQLEKKLKEVEEELAKIEKAATGNNNVFNNYQSIIKENANALTLQSDVLKKYNTLEKDSINLTQFNTQQTDAFAGSTNNLVKEEIANGIATFNLVEEMKSLRDQLKSLIEPQNEVIEGTKKLTMANSIYKDMTEEQIKESDKIAEELWEKDQERYEETAKRVKENADNIAEAERKKRDEQQKTADKNAELTEKQIENGKKLIASAEEQAKAQQDLYFQMANNALQIGTELNRAELQDVDNKYKEEADKYAEMLEKNQITKEEYDTAIKKLENKAAKEKTKILKQQQKIDIAMAVVSTAQATLNAFNSKDAIFMWQKITYAALAAALGAAQISTIAKQKFQEGGLAVGPSHSEGGIPGTVKGRPIEFEGGEIIAKKEVNEDPYTRDIVNYAQVLKKGRRIPGSRNIKGLMIDYGSRQHYLTGSGRGLPSLSSMTFAEGGSTGAISPTSSSVASPITVNIPKSETKLIPIMLGNDLFIKMTTLQNKYKNAGGNLEDIG